MSLTMRQAASQKLDNWYIHINNIDILDFLGHDGLPRNKQQNFKELVERAEIPFKQIKYNDPDADNHIKKDGLQLTDHNRQK